MNRTGKDLQQTSRPITVRYQLARLGDDRRPHDARPGTEVGRQAAGNAKTHKTPATLRNGTRKRRRKRSTITTADGARVRSRYNPRPKRESDDSDDRYQKCTPRNCN